jgi:hypothetical protein
MSVAFALLVVSSAALYAAAARGFASPRFGALTAALFAATPLVWRLALEMPAALAPLPFVAGWLLAVTHLTERRAAWWAIAAGALLGAGAYMSRAAIVMMPLYLLLTIVVLAAAGIEVRVLGAMAAAFAAAVSPGTLALVRHPDVFRQTVNAYRLYDANRFSLRQGIREMASWVGLTARIEVYYDYFNPAFLFLSGHVLLLPLVVLVPAGVYQIVAAETSPLPRLTMAGFLAAPFAASLTAEAPLPARALFLTAFAPIVSAYGVKRLWR